jgi:hypothetical protein
MRLDHIAYACGPDGLAATVARVQSAIGVPIVGGGRHPRSGTTNAIAPLESGLYLEIVAVLDHPAADKAPFGRAVKSRTALGGGWLGWVVAVEDIAPIESRLGRSAVQGHRTRPDGRDLNWLQIGVREMIANPLLPFFIQWMSDPADHPSVPDGSYQPLLASHDSGLPAADTSAHSAGLRLVQLELAGDPSQLAAWLEDERVEPLEGIHVTWVEGSPGIVAAHFETPTGPVRLT